MVCGDLILRVLCCLCGFAKYFLAQATCIDSYFAQKVYLLVAYLLYSIALLAYLFTTYADIYGFHNALSSVRVPTVGMQVNGIGPKQCFPLFNTNATLV